MTNSKTVVTVTPFASRERRPIFYKTINRESVTAWRVANTLTSLQTATVEKIAPASPRESVDQNADGLAWAA